MMVEQHPLFYDKNKFLVTSKGNKVSKQVMIKGSEKISMESKSVIQTGCVLRGDLGPISIGSYVIIREECILRPTYMKQQGRYKYMKMSIGDHVYIDKDCIISALKIGNNVQIGRSCIIGHRV